MMITSQEGKQGDGSHKTIIGQPGSSAWKWMDPIPLGGCLALNWHACRESRVARVTTSTPEIVQAALVRIKNVYLSVTVTRRSGEDPSRLSLLRHSSSVDAGVGAAPARWNR